MKHPVTATLESQGLTQAVARLREFADLL